MEISGPMTTQGMAVLFAIIGLFAGVVSVLSGIAAFVSKDFLQVRFVYFLMSAVAIVVCAMAFAFMTTFSSM